MRGWWQELADLMLPADCAGCGGRRGEGGCSGLCGGCMGALCGVPARRVWPTPPPPGLPSVYTAGVYADEARAVLLAHKERGVLRLAAPLGAALAGAVRAAASGLATWEPLLLVPMPSQRRAVAARGHDPVLRIARAAAGELRRGGRGSGPGSGRPASVLPALRWRRAVSDQVGLSARLREANLAGALGPVPGAQRLLSAGPVVLVDDLMTTGSSLAEAARAVRAAGGEVVAAAVVAASVTAPAMDSPGRDVAL